MTSMRQQKDMQPSLLQRIKESSSTLNNVRQSRSILIQNNNNNTTNSSALNNYNQPRINSSIGILETNYSNNTINTNHLNTNMMYFAQTIQQQSQFQSSIKSNNSHYNQVQSLDQTEEQLYKINDYLQIVDKELEQIRNSQNHDKFKEGDPITVININQGGFQLLKQDSREIIIQTEDPRDKAIDSLLLNNTEIMQQINEISGMTLNVVQKLKIRHHQEDHKIEKDPELENIEIDILKSHHESLMLKEYINSLNKKLDKLSNIEKISEYQNGIIDNQREIGNLHQKIKGLEVLIQKSNDIINQPNPIKDQITLEENELKVQIKQMKRRFRYLDKLTREEIKTNQQDFGNIYDVSKQIDKLKTQLTLIKTNRTIIQNNSHSSLHGNIHTSNVTYNTTQIQKRENSQLKQNNTIGIKQPITRRNDQGLDFSKFVKQDDSKLSLIEDQISKTQKLISFKKKMLENESKMYSQKLKQQEGQYNISIKAVKDTEEIIQLKNQENQKLADELKLLQSVIDPDLLKIFMQTSNQQNLTERPGMLSQSINTNSGGLTIVRSYANLSGKKKLVSMEDNYLEKIPQNNKKDKQIKNQSRINQSLKLDSFNEQLRSSTEQTSATTIPQSNQNQQIYKSMHVGKRLQNLKQLQKEETKQNNQNGANNTNNNNFGRFQDRSRSITYAYNQNHIQANLQNQQRNQQRFRNIINNQNDISFEEAKELDIDQNAINQLRNDLVQNRIGINPNRDLNNIIVPESIILNDKVNGLVQIGKRIE